MSQPSSLGLQSLLEGLWRRRTLLFMPILIAIPLGLAAAIFVPKVYVARSLMVLQETAGGDPFAKDTYVGDTSSQMRERALVLTALVKSDRVLSKVIRDVKKEKTPSDPRQMAEAIQDLSRALSIELIGSEFLEFKLKGDNPSGLANTLKAINVRFLESLLLDQNLLAAPQILLNRKKEEVDAARSALTSVELAMAKRSSTQPLPTLSQLGGMRRQLKERGDQLQRVEAQVAELRNLLGSAALPANQLQKRIAELKASSSAAKGAGAGAKPATPGDVLVLKRLETLAGKEEERVTLEAEVVPLKNAVQSFERAVTEQLKSEQTRQELLNNLKEASTSYEALAARYGSGSASRSLFILKAPERIKLIDPPKDPKLPVITGMRLLIGGLIAGIAMGAGLALAAEHLDQTLRRGSDFAAVTEAPVLAHLPIIPDDVDGTPAQDEGRGRGGGDGLESGDAATLRSRRSIAAV